MTANTAAFKAAVSKSVVDFGLLPVYSLLRKGMRILIWGLKGIIMRMREVPPMKRTTRRK